MTGVNEPTTGWLLGGITIAMLILAGLSKIAIIRAPQIPLSHSGASYRWLEAVGAFGIAARLTFLLWGDWVIEVPWFSDIFFLLWATGMLGTSLDKLAPRAWAETECTLPAELGLPGRKNRFGRLRRMLRRSGWRIR